MSLLICTPMYAGLCQAPYFKSCLELQESLLTNGIDFDFLVTTNESLITRARNTSVAKFLKTDFKYMMFIDGDLEFSSEDVAKLWNLEADVSCAAYPMKKMGKGTTAWKDGVQVPIEDFKEVTSIDFAGTGFLMISRECIEVMIKSYPETLHEESIGDCWALFDTEIRDGVYLSEDYSFCRKWRDIGGEILLDPSIKLKHYGIYGY